LSTSVGLTVLSTDLSSERASVGVVCEAGVEQPRTNRLASSIIENLFMVSP